MPFDAVVVFVFVFVVVVVVVVDSIILHRAFYR